MRPFTHSAAHGHSATRPNSRTGWLVALLAVVAVSTALPAQQDSTSQPAPAPQTPPAQAPAPADTQAAHQSADTTHMPAAVMTPTPSDTTQANPSDSTQVSGQTHTVKKGDTLWDLSQTYLNDPFLWPEIYRINTTIVRDPHWIYPGQVLRIPGGGVQNVADQMEPRLAPEAVPMRSGGPTVFHEDFSKRLSGGNHLEPTSLEYAHTPVRVGEFYAAPWLDAVGGPKAQGKLVATAEIPGIAKTESVAERLGPATRAYITLPAGIVAAKGDRLVVFNRGQVLTDGGQVMQPTAIVQVEATDNGGEATTVRIIQQYDEVQIGQSVMPLDRFNMSTDAHAAPLALGPQAHVIFVPSRAVLPSVGSYVILDATTKDGVKLGDEFTLYRPREKAPIPGTSDQVTLPEEPIALAQVVKVTDRGTTAIILDQRHPSIKEGTAARLTARMP